MYGTQTFSWVHTPERLFENDVKMYGTQTVTEVETADLQFENDVKMYGTQTQPVLLMCANRLRMM